MDKTTLFDIDEITNALVGTTIMEVYDALKEKGYNPVSQIVGYLISGDASYITSYKNAREKIESIERSKILEALVKDFIELQ